MVQFSLPQNSKILKGKYHKDKTGSDNLKKVNVYRWDPSSGENPRIDTYEVDMDNCPSKVLDVLNKIKNEIDPSLAYRPVHAKTLTNDVQYFPPRERVY